jgi:hypothetical protein
MKHLGRFMGYEQKYYLYVHNSRSFAVFSKPSMSWPGRRQIYSAVCFQNSAGHFEMYRYKFGLYAYGDVCVYMFFSI